MLNFVHRIILAVVLFASFASHSQVIDPEGGWYCKASKNQVLYEGWGDTSLSAKASMCSAGGGTMSPNGLYCSFGGQCSGSLVCPTSNGGYVAVNPDGTCPTQCPDPKGAGALPYDTESCGCSDDEYLPISGPQLEGCFYQPKCPESGTTAATGCSGPNGVQYDHTTCLPVQDGNGEPKWCKSDYSNGTFSYNGGRMTQGCSTSVVYSTDDYGCNGSDSKGDDNREGQTDGTPEVPVVVKNGQDTPNDPSDDTTTTRTGSSSTEADGTKVDRTTTTESSSSGTTTTETVIRTATDGSSTTTTTVTNGDGSVTRSVNGTGGQGSCEGPNCEDIADTGKGTVAGYCGKPPVCTAKPIECAKLNQEYNLQCGVKVSDHLNCDELVQCEGDPMGCAIVEQNKQRQCFMALTEGLDESLSLEEDLAGDDGLLYNPDDDSNEVDLSDSLTLDQSGLGWSSSCPSSRTVNVMNASFDISFGPLCDWLMFLNPIVILLGMVNGSFIFLRGISQ